MSNWNKIGKQELAERILTELSALRNTSTQFRPNREYP